jgi:hypothetical protein
MILELGKGTMEKAMQLQYTIPPQSEILRSRWLQTSEDWRGRATKAEARVSELEKTIAEMLYKQDYVKLCAEDIIGFIDAFSLRTFWKMKRMVETLKEAIQ